MIEANPISFDILLAISYFSIMGELKIKKKKKKKREKERKEKKKTTR
jgi:hypothetical protein